MPAKDIPNVLRRKAFGIDVIFDPAGAIVRLVAVVARDVTARHGIAERVVPDLRVQRRGALDPGRTARVASAAL
jgi:hypothetical protein